jgi:hypothetical protein
MLPALSGCLGTGKCRFVSSSDYVLVSTKEAESAARRCAIPFMAMFFSLERIHIDRKRSKYGKVFVKRLALAGLLELLYEWAAILSYMRMHAERCPLFPSLKQCKVHLKT